jgi:CIC family chloride channel protein
MSVALLSTFDISEPAVDDAPPLGGERKVNLLVLCGLALVVGAMTGCGAVALRSLIRLFHNAFYNGMQSIPAV